MNIPCPDRVDCGTGPSVNGFDWPITNYSSEDPDRPVYIATIWPDGPIPIDNSRCEGARCGPDRECFVIATSFQSIQEATYCANRANILCSNGDTASAEVQVDCNINNRPNPPPDPVDPTRPLKGNDPQTCTVRCLDGTAFSYTVPKDTFLSLSKEDANRQAYSAACRTAELKRTCGPTPVAACPHMICADEEWEYQLGDGSLVDYQIVSGSLPPGLSMDEFGHISGNPGKAFGEYTAIIEVSTGTGVSIQYTMWIRVWGYASDTLGAGRIGFPYSEQIQVSGQMPGSNPFISPVHNFGFPDGLTMSAHGLITGTPTTAGDYAFAVQASDGCGGYCQKSIHLTVYAVANKKILAVICPSNKNIAVALDPPIEVGRYNGPAGTSQGQLDSQAMADAMQQAQAQLAAAGCACYVTSLDTTATHNKPSPNVVKSSCNVNVSAYWDNAGVLTVGVSPMQTIGITAAGVDLHSKYYNGGGGYAPGATSTWYFFPAGSVIAKGNEAFTWQHTGHPGTCA